MSLVPVWLIKLVAQTVEFGSHTWFWLSLVMPVWSPVWLQFDHSHDL